MVTHNTLPNFVGYLYSQRSITRTKLKLTPNFISTYNVKLKQTYTAAITLELIEILIINII